jgi:hypothetical protein
VAWALGPVPLFLPALSLGAGFSAAQGLILLPFFPELRILPAQTLHFAWSSESLNPLRILAE